ncbi:histidine phosphotransferase [Vibrio hyugaensis]|uniref:Histidine phosphotransferase n=1 Tax=Vibrio hyugaensis TaxID=1534743 RepID=A0ABQ5XY52_9VIBR|nr:histidine phosphotransferase [Vibrio hyugaensis]
MLQQLKEGIRRVVWILFVVWFGFAVGVWLQAQQTMRTMSTVDELGSKVDEVRNIFHFELPYRAQNVDQVSLKLQLVYAVRLQLESDYGEGLDSPDLTQLIYSTDRFLEGAKSFIGSDSELVALADQLRNSRESASNSQPLQTMYFRLGALVLEAMFSDSATSADTYQELDLLFTESKTLALEEQSSFQRRLAQTSSVLAAHAKGSHLSSQLLNPEFPNQLAAISASLEQKLLVYLSLLIMVSASLLVCVCWALSSKESVLTEGNQSDSENINSPIQPLSHQLDRVERGSEQTELEPANSTEVTNGPERSDSESHQQLLNESPEPYIDIERMLDSLSDDEESVRMLLDVFIQDHTDDGSKLRRLLLEDKEHAQRVAHSLKGVSGSIGAMPLHYISGDIESLIKQGNQVADDKLEQLEETLQKTTLFAERVLNSEKIREVLTD